MANTKLPNCVPQLHQPHHYHQCSQSVPKNEDVTFYGNHDRTTHAERCPSLYIPQIIDKTKVIQHKKRCYSESDKGPTIFNRTSISTDHESSFLNDSGVEAHSSSFTRETQTKIILDKCYRMRLYICVTLMVTTVLASLFFGLIPKLKSDGGEPKEPLPTDPGPLQSKINYTNKNVAHFPTAAPKKAPNFNFKFQSVQKTKGGHHHLYIDSATDLLQVSNKCETVTVKLLKDEFTSQSPEKVTNVKNLNIIGPVTEDWIKHLLLKFHRIENLTIDANELCKAAKVKKKNSLNSLTLENIKSLRVQNSQLCSISSWIFRWNMPTIKHLSIYDSDLHKQVYDPIHSFLQRNNDTLSTVIIARSFLCNECVYDDVKFKNLTIFSISEQRTEPYIMDDM